MENTEKTAILFASRPVSAGMHRYVPPGAFVAAADAGWKNAAALGFAVDLAVGDFDSAEAPKDAKEVLYLSAEKDDTDTHYAAGELVRRGFEKVILLGGLGGRADHAHANWQTLLHLARNGVLAMAADEESELYCIAAGYTLSLSAGGWRWLSVFAAGGTARGVYERGVKYPLHDAVLAPDVPLGVSNEFAASTAHIGCQEGYLYVMVTA